MSFREIALASAWMVAAALIVDGVADWSTALAKVVAGLLVAALAVFFLTEVGS